jgi:hypothetical protein
LAPFLGIAVVPLFLHFSILKAGGDGQTALVDGHGQVVLLVHGARPFAGSILRSVRKHVQGP